ncbi:uncharacterized protein LOC113930469 [Zalophus californianus]|uniref:Uncharacterized protein LOC113930469 n=1 Tax=Zalophus californianus TaxID=9704 RepID=A0A6P9F7A8_ZALCA|nr:uncharacterized protein LOC113930469 [Zalophus californianus]
MDKVISKGILTSLMFYDKSDYILINDELIKHREVEHGCGVCHHGIQVSASIRECGRNKMSQNVQTQRESFSVPTCTIQVLGKITQMAVPFFLSKNCLYKDACVTRDKGGRINSRRGGPDRPTPLQTERNSKRRTGPVGAAWSRAPAWLLLSPRGARGSGLWAPGRSLRFLLPFALYAQLYRDLSYAIPGFLGAAVFLLFFRTWLLEGDAPPPPPRLPPRNSTLTSNESSSNVPSVVLDPLLLQKLQMKLVQKVWDRMLTGYDVHLSPNFEASLSFQLYMNMKVFLTQ